jgi:hypothetical protein
LRVVTRGSRPVRAAWGRVGPPLAIGLAVLVGSLEVTVVALTLTGGAVLIQAPEFVYDTPPTYLCPNVVSTLTPPEYLQVQLGATFNLSWTVGCEEPPGMNASSALFEVSAAGSSTFGFSVMGSTLPIVFGAGTFAFLNLTVRAPWFPVATGLVITVQGGPLPTG